MKKKTDLDLLSANEASVLIGISVGTFRKMRNEGVFTSSEVKIGKRLKYSKSKLLDSFGKKAEITKSKKLEPLREEDLKLCIFSDGTTPGYFNDDTIDLTKFKLIDAYGSLCLLIHLIERSRRGFTTNLIVDDRAVCKELKFIGFFDQLETFAPLVTWSKALMGMSNFISAETMLPITVIKRKGEERRVVEKLLEIFLQHGFSESIGGYLGWMLGELGDNCLTHSSPVLSNRVCFMQAQRYSLGENANCVIVAIADLGDGIHTTLKTNPKYSSLSDVEAFLSAFRHKFSSWPDEFKRGKGLTDMISIAIGNHSIFRASSGENDFLFNFYSSKESLRITRNEPALLVSQGTKFGFVLIDKDFAPISREEADNILKKEIEKWKK